MEVLVVAFIMDDVAATFSLSTFSKGESLQKNVLYRGDSYCAARVAGFPCEHSDNDFGTEVRRPFS